MESLEEKIRSFLKRELARASEKDLEKAFRFGLGCGSGAGSDKGDGEGMGFGGGKGFGEGFGEGSGDGSGYGEGEGESDGSGKCMGYGEGFMKSYNNKLVYYIDGVPTIIDSVREGVARGYIINRDKTLSSCYVAKVGNSFAHGFTLKQAYEDALGKHMIGKNEEERAELFIQEFPDIDSERPCKDLFRWHNMLTGSCEMGRKQFCKDNGIDLKANYKIRFFLDITKDSYGGHVIKILLGKYETKRKEALKR